MAKQPPNSHTVPTYGHPALGFKDGPIKPFRHVVDNFFGAGQDSFAHPPAQDPEMYEEMFDALVSETGTMLPRWGYSVFNLANTGTGYTMLENYQNSNLDRKILAARTGRLGIYNEDGTLFSLNPYTPATRNPRVCVSRDYAFFTGDNKKWNSKNLATARKWGIDAPASALTFSAGGTSATVVTVFPTILQNGWTNNGHVGDYEAGFGNNNDTTYPFDTPENALDADESTCAIVDPRNGSNTHRYSGCVYQFQPQPTWGTPTSVTLNVLGEVSGTGSGYGSVFYSIDGGTTWTQVYHTLSRSKANAAVTLLATQDPSLVQVMIFADSHDYVTHNVYEINLQANLTPVTEALTVGRTYFVVFLNTVDGGISDLSPASATTGAVAHVDFSLANIPVSQDPQVDKKAILATLDGNNQQTLYEVAKIANATTTFTDQVSDAVLATNQIYLSTDVDGTEHGVPDNSPPPAANGAIVIKHKGRLVMGIKRSLYFSKSLDEITTSTGFIAGRYEEAWPADFFLDLSEGAEEVSGLMSYQNTLYVASEKTIRQILGDSPTNFSKPEVVFNGVGVATQDTWQQVFFEGAPIGTIWLTPELRVILSDFNTYSDIGTPVQDVLNTIDQTQVANAKGIYFSYGAYSFYLLYAPTATGSVMLVYNIRTRRWSQWFPTDMPGTFCFHTPQSGVPLMLFGSNSNDNVFKFDPTIATDRGAQFTWTIQTSWLDLGDPSLMKTLNELEVWTNASSPFSSVKLTVQGAGSMADFANPVTIVNKVNPVLGPLNISSNNGIAKLYLAGKACKYKWYRFQFDFNSY